MYSPLYFYEAQRSCNERYWSKTLKENSISFLQLSTVFFLHLQTLDYPLIFSGNFHPISPATLACSLEQRSYFSCTFLSKINLIVIFAWWHPSCSLFFPLRLKFARKLKTPKLFHPTFGVMILFDAQACIFILKAS